MTQKNTVREILGDDDFEELRSEIQSIIKNPNDTLIDKYLDIEQLMNEWGIEPDYMDEFL